MVGSLPFRAGRISTHEGTSPSFLIKNIYIPIIIYVNVYYAKYKQGYALLKLL
ncbi:hypothetical protein WALBB_1540004 [Wolbachia pipientis wAlbB]|nr:hypothetical protein WALBB_1540004 [Wolbachia pipientis wAlbB]